jgi:hypothetical protein
MTERSYTVRVHDEGDGMLWAEVVDLPGCFASGADLPTSSATRSPKPSAPTSASPTHR